MRHYLTLIAATVVVTQAESIIRDQARRQMQGVGIPIISTQDNTTVVNNNAT